ncbi:hypothetical protein FRB95_007442 [Tulasnella sp. JGI-2019a]|nr:hypothetical protein FRB95_007442 [Tulasnella sp. JGI-2019a]
MKHLVEPVLYARIYIYDNLLKHFDGIISVDETVIELVEGGAEVYHIRPYPSGSAAKQKARMIQSLAIVGFDAQPPTARQLLQIASILRAVRSTVSRLFIDVSGYSDAYIDESTEFQMLKAALFELSNIEEYCIAGNRPSLGLELRPIASSSKIKRLMTLYIPLKALARTIGTLPNLQTLVAAFPQYEIPQEDVVTFLGALGTLKGTTVVLDPITATYYTKPLRTSMQQSPCIRTGVVVEMLFSELTTAIEEGEIWTLSESR